MVIDSSALVAILLDEPEAADFARLMKRCKGRVSATNLHETEVTVLRRVGPSHVPRVRELLIEAGVVVEAFDERMSTLATQAYERFGKGRHPARLNLGDCAAYALAASLDVPLLYKGDDFSKTDIRSAVTSG